MRNDIYVTGTNEKGIPTGFCDEEGNIVEDIDWGPLDVILRKEITDDCEIANVGYFAGQAMGIIFKK